jgi:hypothetical protein
MTKIAWSAILGVALIASLLLLVAPAEAQATRSWVSGVGDDANISVLSVDVIDRIRSRP